MKSIAWVTSAAIAAAAALVMLPPANAAGAATLDLSGFDGDVRLVDGPKVEVRSSGWQLAERGGSLSLQPRTRASSPFDDACQGYAAPRTSAASSRGERVEIAIAPGTRVLARAFAGSLQSSATLLEPRIEVRSGKAELAQVNGGELGVSGAGTIAVQQAAGKLIVAVNGPGSVHLRGGVLDQLSATLNGAGRIRHDGVARRAILAADGEGSIRVHEVEEPLRVEQAGFASITIGCGAGPCERR